MNNTQTVLQDWLASSLDATKVANRWEGVFIAASSLIVTGALFLFHINISSTDVGNLATGVGFVVGAIVFVSGLIRSIFVTFGRKGT